MAACENGNLDMVELLLSLPQVDVKAKDEVPINIILCIITDYGVPF